MIDYRNLAALAAVVDEGGFEKAARVLNLTQSAVSQRIRALEEGLGLVLLVRVSPPTPTAAGRRLLALWRQVRRLEEDVLAEVGRGEGEAFSVLPVGVNADSLATWFLPALDDFLRAHDVLLDVRVDDQEVTHELLRAGEVAGCVSERAEAVQGCRVVPLGVMTYRLVAAPAYAARRFPRGMTREAAASAPTLVFNRKDDLHTKLLRAALGEPPSRIPVTWLPSPEGFVRQIARGHVCGMLPDVQSAGMLTSGELVDLAPGSAVRVRLHWHCWNLSSPLLAAFTKALVRGARLALEDG